MSRDAPNGEASGTGASDRGSTRVSTRVFTVVALGLAVAIACGLSIFASGHPDGLEFVAQQAGFLDTARASPTDGSPLADYAVVFVDQPWLSVAIAGAIGCLATFGLSAVVSRVARRRRGDD